MQQASTSLYGPLRPRGERLGDQPGAATGYVLTHTGTVNLNGYSTGAYWTHYGPSGWYIDAVPAGHVLQQGRDHAIRSVARQRLWLPRRLWKLEAIPFRCLWGRASCLSRRRRSSGNRLRSAKANDGLGPVSLGSTSGSTHGRLGVRGQWTILSDNGQWCGNLMCARISGGTGAPRRRQRLESTRYRSWSRQRGYRACRRRNRHKTHQSPEHVRSS